MRSTDGQADPTPAVATQIQILATEHWSLLAARSLTYTESFSRVTIFMAVLSGAIIGLALVAQATGFDGNFTTIAIPILLVVVFVGIATIARLTALNRDDYRWVMGMNRIRHGYKELQPGLERYFTTSPYDDFGGVLVSLGVDPFQPRGGLGSVFHVLQTLPGMLMVIVAAVSGAMVGLTAFATGLPRPPALVAGSGGFVAALVLMLLWSRRGFRARPAASLEPRFPSPPPDHAGRV